MYFGAIIALVLILVILILLVFGNSIASTITNNYYELSGIVNFVLNLRFVFSISIMFIIFLFMYRFCGGKEKKKFKHCIIGAIFTAIAWYLISFFFSIYIDIFTNFSVIYGSLATITVIIMWLYTIIYVILLGAEINVATQENVDYFFKKVFKKM